MSRAAELASKLDLPKLRGSGGSVHLLRYLGSLERALEEEEEEEQQDRDSHGSEPKDEQAATTFAGDGLSKLEKALAQLWQAAIEVQPSGQPAEGRIQLGRPMRRSLARMYAIVFQRREGRGMYEVMQGWLAIFNDTKYDADARFYASEMLSLLLAAHGLLVSSLHRDLSTSCVKVVRATSAPIKLRHSALLCLNSLFQLTGSTIPDQAARDWCKMLRPLLMDKAGLLQRGSSEALATLLETSLTLHTLPELEAILAACLKGLERTPWQAQRRLVRLAASVLLLTQIKRTPAARPKRPSTSRPKAAGDGDEEENDTEAVSATASPAALYTPSEMLAALSLPFNRATTSDTVRSAIFDVLAAVLHGVGPQYIETHFVAFHQHLQTHIVGGAYARTGSREQQVSCEYVALLVDELVLGRYMSEHGQVEAMEVLRQCLWKQEADPDHPSSLQGSSAVSSTISCMRSMSKAAMRAGTSSRFTDEGFEDRLLHLAASSSRALRRQAAATLAAFAKADPSRFEPLIANVVTSISQDLPGLAQLESAVSSRALQRLEGHAETLAALLTASLRYPLYTSTEGVSRAMSLATRMLRESGEHVLSTSSVEIRSSWTIISGALVLGSSIIRLHLPQLMLLWKNAFPKPSGKETAAAASRSREEWCFLLVIREAALSSILAFLRHAGAELATEDVTRRLMILVGHAHAFCTSVPASARASQPPAAAITVVSAKVSPGHAYAACWTRLGQCLLALGSQSALEPICTSVASLSFATLCHESKCRPRADGQAGANQSGQERVAMWPAGSRYGYAVNGLSRRPDHLDAVSPAVDLPAGQETIEFSLESLLRRLPFADASDCGAYVCSDWTDGPSLSGPLKTAISLFALYLPQLNPEDQSSFLLQMATSVQIQHGTEQGMLDQQALLASFLAILAVALRSTVEKGQAKVVRFAQANSAVLVEILKLGLFHSDSILRDVASSAFGRLTALLPGTSFAHSQIQACIAHIVADTRPDGRAGAAHFLGSTYQCNGALAGAPFLKVVVEVNTSLALDPHPTVHLGALSALAKIVTTAGLDYAPHVRATIAMLVQIFAVPTHDPWEASDSTSALAGSLPVQQAACGVLDALVGAIGPALEDYADIQQIITFLVQNLLREADVRVSTQASLLLQHLLLVLPAAIDTRRLVRLIRLQLSSSRLPERIVAIDTVYQLVRREAGVMSRLGGDQFVRHLVSVFNEDPQIEGIKQSILSWIEQTSLERPSGWVGLLRNISEKGFERDVSLAAGRKQQASDDEEALGLSADQVERSSHGTTGLRWQTQLFLIECLRYVLASLQKSSKREHLDPMAARDASIAPSQPSLLYHRLPDLIKICFTSVTASTVEVRLEGLALLSDIVDIFSASRDEEFNNLPLLRQYQASIVSALVPALESSPALAVYAQAVDVAGRLIASGIFADVRETARLLRILEGGIATATGGKESSTDSQLQSGSASAALVRISFLRAWATILEASIIHPQLEPCVAERVEVLGALWLDTLLDLAEREVSDSRFADQQEGSSDTPASQIQWLLILKAYLRVQRACGDVKMAAPHHAVLAGLAMKAMSHALSSFQGGPSSLRYLQTCAACLIGIWASEEGIPGSVRERPTAMRFADVVSVAQQIYTIDDVGSDIIANDLLARIWRCGIEEGQSSNEATPFQAEGAAQLLLASLRKSLRLSSAEGTTSAVNAIALVCSSLAEAESTSFRVAALVLCTDALSSYPVDKGTLEALGNICAPLTRPSSLGSSEGMAAMLGFLGALLDGIDGLQQRQGEEVDATNARYLALLLAGLRCMDEESVVRLGFLYLDRACRVIAASARSDNPRLRQAGLQILRMLSRPTVEPGPLITACASRLVPLLLDRLNAPASSNIADAVALLEVVLDFLASGEPSVPLRVSICLWLARAIPGQDSALQTRAVDELLRLAATAPLAFKAASQAMRTDERDLLAALLQRTLSARQNGVGRSAGQEPTIALKAF